MKPALQLQAEKEIAAKRRKRFPRVWIDEARDGEHPSYRVKGIIGDSDLVVVYGGPGTGKTFFTIDMAGHIAAGLPWRGHRAQQGLCVYVSAEAGRSILRRFAAWRDAKLGDSREERTPLAIITRAVNLLNDNDVDALIEELADIAAHAGLPLAVVVFDTLSRSMAGGDENSSIDMTALVGVADRIRAELGAGSWFVHHAGKDSSRGIRGHSALFGAADVVISVADHVATVEKSRDNVAGQTFPFRLEVVDFGVDSDGDPVSTCVAMPSDVEHAPKRKPRQLTGVAQVALTALREAVSDCGEVLPATSTIPAGVRASTIDAWRRQFRIRYGSDDRGERAIRQAFQRGREHLLRERLVIVSDPYVWATGGT